MGWANDCGDTLIIAELTDVSISSPEVFANAEEYKQYRRYRIYAQRAYPYAVDAIRIFRETEYMTQNMSNRERRRYIKRLQNELEERFEEPLKKMSKTQGKVLIAMIERADPVLRDYLKASGFGFVPSGTGLPTGFLPSDAEPAVADALRRLNENLSEFSLVGADLGGFDFGALVKAIASAQPLPARTGATRPWAPWQP